MYCLFTLNGEGRITNGEVDIKIYVKKEGGICEPFLFFMLIHLASVLVFTYYLRLSSGFAPYGLIGPVATFRTSNIEK